MALIDLWRDSRAQILEKHVQQIVAFAGDGRLADGNAASSEFRVFLAQIPSDMLTRYTSECLLQPFSNSGLVLQDTVNEIGARLGFEVTAGRYRGVTGQPGFDGLWRSVDGHSIVVEVKTTDTYRIDLDIIANYRRSLVRSGTVSEEHSSILIVVGRDDTGDLEAQIRGSRHAWDVRLISTEALVNLMAVKEELEDPAIQSRIHSVLRPREFTRLDEIVDLLFSTAEDIKQEQVVEEILGRSEDHEAISELPIDRKPKFVPVAFHDACIRRIERVLGISLLKRSRATFETPDQKLKLICAISREHTRSGSLSYWFAFHQYQAEYLRESENSYLAFGCGSEHQLLLIPYREFEGWREGMNETTTSKGRAYKHVSIFRVGNKLELVRRQGWPRIDLTRYLLAN